MLILTGVVINTLMGDNGLIDSTISTVEKSNIATYKEKIELAIIELMAEGERNITIDKIIDKVIEKDITSEENSNRDTGQVKTEGDYIYEIKEKEEGGWEVIYIGKGELAKTELAISVTKDVDVLTNKVTVTITAKADSGIKSYTNPERETKTYNSGEKEISETYEISSNGTYIFTVENNKGKTERKEIEISNILEGTIGISANTSEATNKDVIVTVVWPSGSEAGIKEIQVGEGKWQTYEGESSQVTIKENCTIRARITSEVGELTSATLEITNIDKTEPTEPTITGGSTEYATSRTISVSTESTDEGSGVAYYQYYLSSSSTAPTSSTVATGNVGSTASVTSKTFNTNYAGYYVYFRAVDNAENKGAWSSAQRLYIDINKPIVTAKQSSVTIIQGNSNAISNYFIVSANGNAAISSTTYKEGSTTISNTSTLSSGTHTITCTATKANGLSASASISVVVNIEYAKKSYTTPGTYTWTVPAGVTKIKVTVAGAGGGGRRRCTSFLWTVC